MSDCPHMFDDDGYCVACGYDLRINYTKMKARAKKAEARVKELEAFIDDLVELRDCAIEIDGSRYNGINVCDNRYRFKRGCDHEPV